MFTSKGFILRSSWQEKDKIDLFDQLFGKIEAINKKPFNNAYNSAGFLLTYCLELKKERYYIESIALEQECLGYARHNIYFLHYVLELCYYLLPSNVQQEKLFELIEFLIQAHQLVSTKRQKELFLLRFLLYLGLYPEEDEKTKKLIEALVSIPIQVMLEKKVELPKNFIARWIHNCTQDHPRKKNFKLLNAVYHEVY